MSELADHKASGATDSFSVLERQKSVAETFGIPVAVLLELTHRCPLQCPYCSNPLELDRASTELSTEEWKKVLSELAEIGVLQVHFSGGEPTARKDLVELVRHANDAVIARRTMFSPPGTDMRARTKTGRASSGGHRRCDARSRARLRL